MRSARTLLVLLLQAAAWMGLPAVALGQINLDEDFSLTVSPGESDEVSYPTTYHGSGVYVSHFSLLFENLGPRPVDVFFEYGATDALGNEVFNRGMMPVAASPGTEFLSIGQTADFCPSSIYWRLNEADMPVRVIGTINYQCTVPEPNSGYMRVIGSIGLITATWIRPRSQPR